MKRYFHHLKNSWKAICLIASVFQLVTVVYVVFSLIKGKFEFELLLPMLGFTLGFGAFIALINVSVQITSLDEIKKLLSTIELHKVRGGSLKLIDEYRNGWGRSVMIRGTFQNKKIEIQHKREKGKKGRDLILVILVELEKEFYEEAGALKFSNTTNADSITNALNNAIIASKDPKFGEIYWELKRRRSGK